MGSGVAGESLATARKEDYSGNVRTGLNANAIATALIDNLDCLQAKPPQYAIRNDWYMALAYIVRDRMMHRYIATVETITGTSTDAKVVAYLPRSLLRLADLILIIYAVFWTSPEHST
jgi:starch phosphorylase